MTAPAAPRSISVRLIILAAAEAFGVSVTELRSCRRTNDVLDARAAACLLARELIGKSYRQVGRSLGNREHATIMNAVARAEAMRSADPEFAVRYEAAKLAIQTIANSKLAELIRDDTACDVAARICEQPSLAARTSTLQIIAMAVRLVTLEELASDAFRMLADLDVLVDEQEPTAALRRDLATRITTITETLGALGYVNPQGEAHV